MERTWTGQDKKALRTLVRLYDDFQKMRIKTDNRLGRKSGYGIKKDKETGEIIATNEEMQNVQKRDFRPEDEAALFYTANLAAWEEKELKKKLLSVLGRFPVFTEYMSNVTSLAEVVSAWILSEIDIDIADTPSKIFAFAGVSPGMTFGKKVMTKKEAEKKGYVIHKPLDMPGSKDKYIVITPEKVRQDRKTTGFLCPYNQQLKKVLLGILGANFIKQNPYYRDLYIDFRMFYIQKDMEETGRLIEKYYKMNGDKIEWKPGHGHIHAMARRKMIKEFIKELYANWRRIEGLPVREPYEKAKLGHEHGGKIITFPATRIDGISDQELTEDFDELEEM